MTLATEYLRQRHQLMNCLYFFSFSAYAALLPGVLDGEKYTGCDSVSVTTQFRCWFLSQTDVGWKGADICMFFISSGLPWSYLILVASGKIPCHYESQRGKQNLLSFFVSLVARTWKSMQNYFGRKVLWRCVTPDSSLFLFLWYESRSLNWSDQWKLPFEL